MNDPKQMTDQQLNVALAEITGFPTDKLTPNYCNDPAASLEVQAKALQTNQVGYMAHLTYVTGHDYHKGLTYDTAASMLKATPRQRAEAAYMTLSQAGGTGA